MQRELFKNMLGGGGSLHTASVAPAHDADVAHGV